MFHLHRRNLINDTAQPATWLGPGARASLIVGLLIAIALTFRAVVYPTPDESTLTNAAATGDFAAARRALDAGISPNTEYGLPLLLAAARCDTDITTLLLTRGADPSLMPIRHYTPLMMAAFAGHAKTVALLLDAGADPNQAPGAAQTPLAIAAAWGHEDVVNLLLARGASPSVNDHDPPLVSAARGGIASAKLLRRLIDAGADVNAADSEGVTAIMVARDAGRRDLVLLLLRAGARPHPPRLAQAPAVGPTRVPS